MSLFFLLIALGKCVSDSQKGPGKDGREAPAANQPGKTVEFGKGDDYAAWLSICDPPPIENTTANDNPRPPVPTRTLSYPSKGVDLVLVPVAAIGAPPPYSAWRLIGLKDPANNQPITAREARKRMGELCR